MTRTRQARSFRGVRLQHTVCPTRHWFAFYGYVGSSSPVCVRCGAPNPGYRPDDDPITPRPHEAAENTRLRIALQRAEDQA